ncbi:MAG: chemotaxis protein CheW [Halothiobacillaceae bacterium]
MNALRPDVSTPGGVRGDVLQYLSFILHGQEYAVDILRVQEIREWGPTTPIPNSAGFVRGVMNLRGSVVPVVDLRLRLGLPEVTYDAQTVVIVLRVLSPERDRIMGVVVDAVAEVHDLAPQAILPPPEVTAQGLEGFVLGLVDSKGQLLTILDFDRLLDTSLMLVDAAGSVSS